MRKVWILDTETKGTGAHVAPYEKARQPVRDDQELAIVALDRPPRPTPEPEPPQPLLFKVVNVMSSQVLGEGVGARDAVELLEGMGSVLDARIFVWLAKSGRWRLLTLDESKLLWGFRGRLDLLERSRADIDE